MHYAQKFSMDGESYEQSFGFVGEPADIFREDMFGSIANTYSYRWLSNSITFS